MAVKISANRHLSTIIHFLHIRRQVFIAPSAQTKYHYIIGFKFNLVERSKRMGGFQCGDDAFQSCYFKRRIQGLLVGSAEECTASGGKKIRVQRADARVIQPGGYAVGFNDLAIFRLHQKAHAAMQDTGFSQLRGSGT